MFNVFEHPWGLILVAILATAVIWIIHAVGPDKSRWWQWLIPVAIMVAAVALDVLVQTDLEKINKVITKGVKAVEREDVQAIDEILSTDYRDSYHINKQVIMSYAGVFLSEPIVNKAIKRNVQVEISPAGTSATATFTVRVVFDQSSPASAYKSSVVVNMKLDLKKQRPGRWLISRAELLAIDMIPATWQDIRQAGW